ncbi:hypothetical protein [Saccharicrinis aurantiacus]|uniref:hypothetical protein n=1 Tax=Saccharicrinis aurantiacus TaxID=1849719 RepID=UPI002491F2DA|nr:hypothetical protein [Saccharicrinis aurantiacus]
MKKIRNKENKSVNYNLKDIAAERLLKNLTEEPLKKMKPIGLTLQVELSMDIVPINTNVSDEK